MKHIILKKFRDLLESEIGSEEFIAVRKENEDEEKIIKLKRIK